MLNVLGPVQVLIGEKEIGDFRTSKVQALLIYLALEPDAHRREVLMELLWPGMPERSARLNLRQILYHLRNAVSDLPSVDEVGEASVSFVVANRQTIQRNPAASVTIDSERFNELIDSTISHEHPDLFICHHCRERLEEAVVLYRDNFLADFYLDDSNAFEHWAQVKREVYARRTLDGLETLSTIYMREKNYSQARTLIDRQLQIDDLREGAYRQMMQLLALAGRREEALRVYEKCRRLLVDELGMEPSKHTTELYEQILAGELSFDTPVARGVRGYELKEEIGRGAAGTIHRAVQPAIKREVAVKVIRRRYANDPEFIRRFEAEAQIIAQLEHPHIVPLYDYWRDPDGAYLVMRYLKGGSLLSALESGPWNPELAVKMLDQVCAALSAAHRHGVVHRDIKPANILLDEDSNAFLADFGIAKDLSGQEQLTAIGAAIGTPDYISPEQIRNDNVSPQSDIYSLGAVLYETLTGEKPFPDASVANLIYRHLNEPVPIVATSRSDLPPRVDDVIQRATAKRPSDRYADALKMAEAFRAAVLGSDGAIAILGIPETIPEIDVYNPYKGLRAFQEADCDDFFGREAFVDQLVRHLSESRFLALVGPSGSGKSSSVKAGLIPVLRGGAILPEDNVAGSKNWFVAEMVPGTHPLEELELALWPVAVDPPPSLVGPMERDTRGLLRTIRRILPDEEGAQLLLVIDQFEELFTLVEDEERRAFFIDSLLQAIAAPRSPLRVVITLRADFYDRPLQIDTLGALLRDHTEVVLPLSTDELTWAIREPARRMGVGLEQGLIEAIIADVAEQSGSLPLLQYTLTELFDRRQDRLMTRLAYQEMGGLRGMLGRRADAIYSELEPAGQEATRQIFLRLVTLGEGVEDTRRRVLRSKLEAIEREEQPMADDGQQPPAPISKVIDKFGEARLLTFDRDPKSRRPTVEVAHEALLREWNRLSNWLDNSRADIRNQRELDRAARAWLTADKDGSYLLRGSRLSLFADWATRSAVALTSEEWIFLDASLAARRARQEAEAARQQQELETARTLAETEKARAEAERSRAEEQASAARRFRQMVLVLAGILVVAIVLAVLAAKFGRNSSQNADLAATREAEAVANAALAVEREAEARANADLAATREAEANASSELAAEAAKAEAEAAVEALEQKALAEQERAFAEEQARISQSRELAAASANSLGIDPELGILLAKEALTTAHTVEAEQALHTALLASRVRQRLVGHQRPIERLAYTPDGSLIALAAFSEELATIWDAASGQKLYEIPVAGCCWGLYFDDEGQHLLAAEPGETFSLAIWDMATGLKRESYPLPIDPFEFYGYYPNPSWTQVAFAQTDGTIAIWDLLDGQQLFDLPGHMGAWVELEYSADGSRLVTVEDGLLIAWDATTGEVIRQIDTGHGVNDHVVSPDGRLVAVAWNPGGSGVIDIWDLDEAVDDDDLSPSIVLTGQSNEIWVLAFNPNGRLLASASRDGTSRVWDIATGEIVLVLPHGVQLRSVVFHPSGNSLLTSDITGVARVWDLSPRGSAERLGLTAHDDQVFRVSFSPDGRHLVTASFDGTAKIWDPTTGELEQSLEGHSDRVTNVAYHPDGQHVATTSTDGTARIWDAATGRLLLTLEGHGEGIVGGFWVGVLGVSFNPDGERVATAGADGTARIWDANSGEELLRLEGHPEGLTKVLYSPDGRFLATSSDSPIVAVRIWDAETGDELFTIEGVHGDRIWGLDFSPDGRFLATAGGDTSAKIWALDYDAGQAELLATLDKHANTVLTVRFSPDGRQLATATGDEVRLWDISGVYDGVGELFIPELLLLPGGPGTDFSPDGRELISADRGGVLRAFVLDTGELMDLAQSRVTRSLSTEECRQYLHVAECPPRP